MAGLLLLSRPSLGQAMACRHVAGQLALSSQASRAAVFTVLDARCSAVLQQSGRSLDTETETVMLTEGVAGLRHHSPTQGCPDLVTRRVLHSCSGPWNQVHEMLVHLGLEGDDGLEGADGLEGVDGLEGLAGLAGGLTPAVRSTGSHHWKLPDGDAHDTAWGWLWSVTDAQLCRHKLVLWRHRWPRQARG